MTSFVKHRQARIKADERDWIAAAELWRQAEESVPQAWWSSMELLRTLRHQVSNNSPLDSLILFSPDYWANPYQRNLYSRAAGAGIEVRSTQSLPMDLALAQASKARRLIFHQHWIKELYWTNSCEESGRRSIDLHISHLRALQAFGARIVWTLHNLIDHDATEVQERNCIYALGEMARVSDDILIHTNGSADALCDMLSRDVRHKCILLPHALYSDLKGIESRMPAEWIEPSGSQLVALCAGILRPYKGAVELLQALSLIISSGKTDGIHLVIAGQMKDPQLAEVMAGLPHQVRRHLTFIPRALADDELVALVRRADLCVTPYRKILISGSYYLNTTFAKPTLAPKRGMFAELITSGHDGFLYDGSVSDLAHQLAALMRLPRGELDAVGQRAFAARSGDTIEPISDRYLTLIGMSK